MSEFKLDAKNIRQVERQIEELSERGIPIAIQQTLNNTARHAFNSARRTHIPRQFSERNTYTKRSVTYDTTRSIDVDSMHTTVGSSADYMREQEEGLSRTSRGQGVWVPTAEAADQSGAKRTKPIKAKHRRSRIKVRRKRANLGGAASRAQAKYFKIYNALIGNGYYWGTLGKTRGMWLVTGGVNNGRISLTGVRLLYSATRKAVQTRAHPWLLPASEDAMRKQPEEYYKALKRQLRRVRQKYRRK